MQVTIFFFQRLCYAYASIIVVVPDLATGIVIVGHVGTFTRHIRGRVLIYGKVTT